MVEILQQVAEFGCNCDHTWSFWVTRIIDGWSFLIALVSQLVDIYDDPIHLLTQMCIKCPV